MIRKQRRFGSLTIKNEVKKMVEKLERLSREEIKKKLLENKEKYVGAIVTDKYGIPCLVIAITEKGIQVISLLKKSS